jgi:hypothetical protein
MRFISRRFTHLSIGSLLIGLVAPLSLAQPDCVSSAPDGYSSPSGCTVTIDRSNPASPPTLVVRGRTTVTIVVANARGNELLSFTPVTSKLAPVDVAGTFVRSAITPLQNLVTNVGDTSHRFNAIVAQFPPGDPIVNQYNALFTSISTVLTQMANASAELSCLEAYRSVVSALGGIACSPTLLNTFTFVTAKQTTATDLLAAAKATLPLGDFQRLHTQVSPTPVPANFVFNSEYLSLDALANTVLTDTQKAQAAMFETENQVADLPAAPVVAPYTITEGKSYSSIVTVTAQEIISKTNTTLATVTINWQSTPWEISTGILFSALKDQTFTNANIVTGGQPVLDPASGKNLTVVQNAYTRPTVLVPMVMANYRLGFLSHFDWENRCPNHCAFVLSGGVGLNVNQKTAEFATGLGFQIGALIFSAGPHVGRYNDLADGIGVGAQLGVSPPSPLPTVSRWTAKLGFTVSYVLPFQ